MRLASCFCLATASGVMAYVSLVEVFGEAKENFEHSFAEYYPGDKNEKIVETYALLCATGTFFAGWFVALAMDWARVFYSTNLKFNI